MRWQAVLLLGPTGAGKTPLGQLLEQRGLKGKRCLHFDFGNALRTSANNPMSPLAPEELLIVKKSLATGALLADKDFGIAEKLLVSFAEERKADDDTLIILNGLPRHTGQAKALEPMVDMQALVILECPDEVILDRIRRNSGGDRDGRSDDTLLEVKQRLEIFNRQTAPLVDYYGKLQVPLVRVNVKVETTARNVLKQIETCFSQ